MMGRCQDEKVHSTSERCQDNVHTEKGRYHDKVHLIWNVVEIWFT